jgi:hypothetical protein
MWKVPNKYQPLVVYLPTTWLLRVVWRKHELIGCREAPRASARGTAVVPTACAVRVERAAAST